MPFDVRRLGRVGYGEALELQAKLVEERRRGAIGDTMLLLEHPPVITLGVKTRGKQGQHRRDARGARGRRRRSVRDRPRRRHHLSRSRPARRISDLRSAAGSMRRARYVRDIEEALIVALREFGIEGGRVTD